MIEQFVRYVARLHFVALVLLLDNVLLDAFVDQAILILGVLYLVGHLFWSGALALGFLLLAD